MLQIPGVNFCNAPKPKGPYTQIPCYDPPKFEGPFDNSSTRGIFVVTFMYIFSYKYTNSYNILQEFDVQLFYTFTCQHILKLDCFNIFYKKYFSRPQLDLLCTHYLEGAPSSRVPERVVPRRGEQNPINISSTKATPHLRAICNANT